MTEPPQPHQPLTEYDGPGSTLGRYGVTGFPETSFVNRNGNLVGEHIKGQSPSSNSTATSDSRAGARPANHTRFCGASVPVRCNSLAIRVSLAEIVAHECYSLTDCACGDDCPIDLEEERSDAHVAA